MNNFELTTEIAGKNAMQYMADLLEKNDKQQIEIERGKLNVAILKQMNNRSRLLLDSAKYELKAKEFELEQMKQSKSES
jgi:hypothetical protein